MIVLLTTHYLPFNLKRKNNFRHYENLIFTLHKRIPNVLIGLKTQLLKDCIDTYNKFELDKQLSFIMNIVIAIRWILFSGIFLISSTSACENDEINEASEAFRNCAGSSEDTIYRRVAEVKEEDRRAKMCSILETLYSGCKAQKSALEKCKGVEHVSKIVGIFTERNR